VAFFVYQQGFCPVIEAMKSDENLGNTREILFNGIITVNNFFSNFLSKNKKRKKEKKTSLRLLKTAES